MTRSWSAPTSWAPLVLAGALLAAPAPAQEGTAARDPRVQLHRLQSAGDLEAALAEVERQLETDPKGAEALGLPYLRAHLLDRLGRPRAASQAFANAMVATPALAAHARLRIARLQDRLGHPEVSAGLTATLLGNYPPRSLHDPASRLLLDSIERGGDCRLLRDLDGRQFATDARRLMSEARASCFLRQGQSEAARTLLLGLLRESVADAAAHDAAHLLLRLDPVPDSEEVARLLGSAFHRHREFERAKRYLEPLVSELGSGLTGRDYGVYFEAVRSDFWLGRYDTAARRYGDLAARSGSDAERAQALFHRGRSLELSGNWSAAIDAYRASYGALSSSDQSGSALIGALRLHWRRDQRTEALELLETLRGRRAWRFELSRAALFLAASELVRGETEGVAGWLATADSAHREAAGEVAYWSGRLAELEGRKYDAVGHYAELLLDDPFHPLAVQTRERLHRPALAEVGARVAVERARSSRLEDLQAAWQLAGEAETTGRTARIALERRLAAQPVARPFLEASPTPIDEWPLWQGTLRQPEELLLGLGIWQEAEDVVARHFPVAQPELALAASLELERAGALRRSLWLVEILQRRKPASVPDPLVSRALRERLFPRPWEELFEASAKRHEVDRWLLTAIAREESRFDATALSAAGARGLTQFILPTARRLGPELGWATLEPRDLERPEISIELGAALLAELGRRYEGRQLQMVAAYNAGEAQAELWQSYCYGTEPAEYYTKVTFRETRSYLTRVMRSRNQYQDLYGTAAVPAAPGR